MGINERKEREKEDLRKAILQAAKELFRNKGFEAISIRNIAERIEYSPTTIYLYYKDKNAIMHGLHCEGFALLGGKLAVLANVKDPFERLKAMGRTYIQFAFENPDFYDLMFVMIEPMCHVENHDENWEEGKVAYHVLYSTVVECMSKGYFKDMEPHGLSFAIWSTVHGMCTLKIKGHFEHVKEMMELPTGNVDMLEHAFETFSMLLEHYRK